MTVDAFVDYFSTYSCCNLHMSICTLSLICLTLLFTPNFNTFNKSVQKTGCIYMYIHCIAFGLQVDKGLISLFCSPFDSFVRSFVGRQFLYLQL